MSTENNTNVPSGDTGSQSSGAPRERSSYNRGENKNYSSGGYQGNRDNKGGFFKRPPRRKVCSFCVNKVEEIDYIKLAQEINRSNDHGRDGERRPRYITEKGRILPRRMSGVCVKHQRALATAVKRARVMALLPYQAD